MTADRGDAGPLQTEFEGPSWPRPPTGTPPFRHGDFSPDRQGD